MTAVADDVERVPEGSPELPPELTRLFDDLAGAMVSVVCALGIRLGLFRELAVGGPMTSDELAARAKLDERYCREWLHCLASAGYVDTDRTSQRFGLSPVLAFVLGTEGSPLALDPAYELIAPLVAALPAVGEAFVTGAGVHQSAYAPGLHDAMERMSSTWIDTMLVDQWIGRVPGLSARLTAGGRIADIGCGGGHALVVLASAFPNSRCVGCDLFADNVARARAAASNAGVDERAQFVHGDAADVLEGPLDLVTAFDVLHDAPDLDRVLRTIRASLEPDGVLLVVESHSADDPLDNQGSQATVLYATSLLYCVPTALAEGGEGLGTLGLPAGRLQGCCAEAGFRVFRRLPSGHPFNAVYEIRP